jgi:hypothetical protein
MTARGFNEAEMEDITPWDRIVSELEAGSDLMAAVGAISSPRGTLRYYQGLIPFLPEPYRDMHPVSAVRAMVEDGIDILPYVRMARGVAVIRLEFRSAMKQFWEELSTIAGIEWNRDRDWYVSGVGPSNHGIPGEAAGHLVARGLAYKHIGWGYCLLKPTALGRALWHAWRAGAA